LVEDNCHLDNVAPRRVHVPDDEMEHRIDVLGSGSVFPCLDRVLVLVNEELLDRYGRFSNGT
jgi:hypothetical protein